MLKSATLPAADTAALLRTTSREHLEGDTILLQDLQVHLSALRLQIAEVPSATLRRLMAVEIGAAESVLRGFTIVQAERSDQVLASAERALAEVRAYVAREEYAEGLGYARGALARVVESLGGAPVPPLPS